MKLGIHWLSKILFILLYDKNFGNDLNDFSKSITVFHSSYVQVTAINYESCTRVVL